ncbi:unnamed protein product [Caenorhabditis brenneri]
MIICEVLTKEIIDCFHLCTVKGDYHQLFNNYRPFFRSLGVNLRRVIFPGHHLCKIIFLELRYLLDFLKDWNENDPNSQLGLFYWKDQIPEFFQHLKLAIIEKNWQSFYEEYRSIADLMIREARKQEILDFRIEYGSESFESFESMDAARSLIPDEYFSEPDKAGFCINYFLDAEGYFIPPEPPERFSDRTNEETSTSSVSLQFPQQDISGLKQYFKEEFDKAKQEIKECNQAQLKRIEAKLDNKLTSIMNKVTSSERRLEATPTDDHPIDLKAELAKMNQFFTQGMTELRVMISNFKTEMNDKLEQIEARIKHGTSDSQEKISEKIQSMKHEVGTKITEFDEKMNLRNEVLEGKIEHLAELIQRENETESVAFEPDHHENKDQDNEEDVENDSDPEPEVHENDDGAKRDRDENDENIRAIQEDIQEEFERALVSDDESDQDDHRDQDNEEDIEKGFDVDHDLYENLAMDDDEDFREMEEAFQRALAEQNRLHEEELQRVQNRRRELNRAAEEERRRIRNAANRGVGGL